MFQQARASMTFGDRPCGSEDYAGKQGYWQTTASARRPRLSSFTYKSPQLHADQTLLRSSPISTQSSRFPQRRPSNRDEFDGPAQLLDKPYDSSTEPREEELPRLPVSLFAREQDELLTKVHTRLSQCAFNFIAKYQFPIPLEPDKRRVEIASDREWSEWVYLIKRLATKRRIPVRVLYDGQVKQVASILDQSLETRHAGRNASTSSPHSPRTSLSTFPSSRKDDRNILQLISAGLQVAKILKDKDAMADLDGLYVQTEMLMWSRRRTSECSSSSSASLWN